MYRATQGKAEPEGFIIATKVLKNMKLNRRQPFEKNLPVYGYPYIRSHPFMISFFY